MYVWVYRYYTTRTVRVENFGLVYLISYPRYLLTFVLHYGQRNFFFCFEKQGVAKTYSSRKVGPMLWNIDQPFLRIQPSCPNITLIPLLTRYTVPITQTKGHTLYTKNSEWHGQLCRNREISPNGPDWAQQLHFRTRLIT